MIAAGGIVYMNTRVTSTLEYFGEHAPRLWGQYNEVGWPYRYVSYGERPGPDVEDGKPAKLVMSTRDFFSRATRHDLNLTNFIDDLGIALLILALTFGAWEGLLLARRKLAAKPRAAQSEAGAP